MMVRSGSNRALALWCACAVGLTAGLSRAQAEQPAAGSQEPTVAVTRALETLTEVAGFTWADAVEQAVQLATQPGRGGELLDEARALVDHVRKALRSSCQTPCDEDESLAEALAAVDGLLYGGYRHPADRAEPTFIENVTLADPDDAWTLDTPQVMTWDLDYGLGGREAVGLPRLSSRDAALLVNGLAGPAAILVPEPASAALLALPVMVLRRRRGRASDR